MIVRPKKDLIEVFGYAPDDLTPQCRSLWKLSACPFINRQCTKANHDGSVIYGTCSVTSPYGDCIICPNRLYEQNYATLRTIADEVFGAGCEFLMYEQFIPLRETARSCIVALGQNSGKEVKIGTNLSMDWVLAKIENRELVDHGKQRTLVLTRSLRFSLEEFSQRFISGPNLPTGLQLDTAVKRVLGVC